MASKKEPRFTEKQYLAGTGPDDGWLESDVMYDGKKLMENAPESYANELQREMGRAKTMQQVNYPKEEPVKKAKGGKISSASKRADGCAIKGKTRGKIV